MEGTTSREREWISLINKKPSILEKRVSPEQDISPIYSEVGKVDGRVGAKLKPLSSKSFPSQYSEVGTPLLVKGQKKSPGSLSGLEIRNSRNPGSLSGLEIRNSRNEVIGEMGIDGSEYRLIPGQKASVPGAYYFQSDAQGKKNQP